MADQDASDEGFGWTHADTERRRAQAGLHMTPAERLAWLEQMLDELVPLVGRAREVESELRRTTTVVRLVSIGVELVSRSEGKRLVRGLERFREVVLDFEGVRVVGQGFADEVFRVWSAANPEVRLIPVGMCEPVAFMVERARRAGPPTG